MLKLISSIYLYLIVFLPEHQTQDVNQCYCQDVEDQCDCNDCDICPECPNCGCTSCGEQQVSCGNCKSEVPTSSNQGVAQ